MNSLLCLGVFGLGMVAGMFVNPYPAVPTDDADWLRWELREANAELRTAREELFDQELKTIAAETELLALRAELDSARRGGTAGAEPLYLPPQNLPTDEGDFE